MKTMVFHFHLTNDADFLCALVTRYLSCSQLTVTFSHLQITKQTLDTQQWKGIRTDGHLHRLIAAKNNSLQQFWN